MIEIAGYMIDPAKVSCIGPVMQDDGFDTKPYFIIVVEGASIRAEFEPIELAVKARKLMTKCYGLP